MPLAPGPGTSKRKGVREAASRQVERAAAGIRRATQEKIDSALVAFYSAVSRGKNADAAAADLVKRLFPILSRSARQSAALAMAGWTGPARKLRRKKAEGRVTLASWLDDNEATFVETWATRWSRTRVLERCRTLAGTARRKAASILRFVTENLSREGGALPGQNAIAAEFMRQGVRTARWQAAMIARTEIHNAMSEADRAIAKEVAKDVGPLMKTWAASQDERTRPDHEDADDDSVKANEKFIVGGVPMDGPGDVSAPPEQTINCRCVLLWEPEGGWD